MSYVRIRLPGGTLKVKPYVALRSVEREHRVPMMNIGPLYFVWWANRNHDHRDPPTRH